MARTKQTARRWMGGKSPRTLLPTRRDREVLDRRAENRAAIRVQSLARGHMARKKKLMATRIQSFARGYIVRKTSCKRTREQDENEPPLKRLRTASALASEKAAQAASQAATSASAAVASLDL